MSNSSFRPNIPYNPDLKEKARELRNNPTAAEKTFWAVVRKMSFYSTVKFYRQIPLGNYIVDFFCPALELVVEIDGHSHGEDDQRVYDAERTAFLESNGLSVLRFTNPDVLNNTDGVMEILVQWIETRKEKSP